MANPVRLFVIETEDECWVYDEESLRAVDIPLDDSAKEHFGGQGKWREIWLKKALAVHKSEIVKLCQVADANGTMRFDQNLWEGAQCQVLIEKWNGFPKAPGIEAFQELPIALADTLTQILDVRRAPNMAANPFFIAAWSNHKSRRSEANSTKQPEPEEEEIVCSD